MDKTEEQAISEMTEESNQEESPDEMTEQIEASFGPMSVYISGTDTENVQDTFDHVWDRMLETSDKLHERKEKMDDSDYSSQTFG